MMVVGMDREKFISMFEGGRRAEVCREAAKLAVDHLRSDLRQVASTEEWDRREYALYVVIMRLTGVLDEVAPDGKKT